MPGVSPSDGSNYYRTLVKELEQELDEQARRSRERLDRRESELARNHARELSEQDRDAEAGYRRVKAEANESVEKERDSSRAEVERLKRLTYEKNGRTRLENETSRQREQMLQQMDESERALRDRSEALNANVENRLRRSSERTNESLKNQASRLGQSHAREMGHLQEQVSDLLDSESRYIKEKGRGTADAVREYESDWRDRQRITVDGFQDQIENLKHDKRAQESYLERLKDRAIRDKDRYFSSVISRQNAEQLQRLREAEDSYSRNVEEMDNRLRSERDRHESVQASSREDANRKLASALQNQATSYNRTLKNQTESSRDQISTLTDELNVRKTTSDTSLISPAAEAKIRRVVGADYEKILQAEQDRNWRGLEGVRDEYTAALEEANQEADLEKSQLSRTHANERNQQRAEFLSHMYESDFLHEATLRTKDEEIRREMEKSSQRGASALDRQRLDFESLLATQRDNAIARIRTIRQEADFNAKMSQRAFAIRQNELIREYDRKLADQKQDYEALLDEMKAQTQQQLRESDRKHKQILDEQARFYEQRQAQQEVQKKERERVITQNYESDLEKLRRSNALLIQKKS